jgi:hypothetical protein
MAERKGPVSFGLEVELSLRFNPDMVNGYRPPIESDESWLALTHEERLSRGEYWNRISQELFFRDTSFERLRQAPAFLPSELIAEGATLTNEIKSPVYWSVQECSEFLYSCESTFGPAQVQGHVVCERRAIPGFAGFSIFESDAAMLKTLVSEYAAYLDCKRMPAGNFIARFLPPVSERSKTTLLDMEQSAAVLSRPLTELGAKFAAPALRPGKLYGQANLMGFELRQWDTPSVGAVPMAGRAEELLVSMYFLEQILLSEHGFSGFESFVATPLDGREALARALGVGDAWDVLDRFLFCQAQHMGFRSSNPGVRGVLEETDHAMTQLVSWPFRPWEEHPVFAFVPPMMRAQALDRIQGARTDFLGELRCVVRHLPSLQAPLDRSSAQDGFDDVLSSLRVNLARWADTSGLSSLFGDDVYDQLLPSFSSAESI